jgi:hypothetical protein
MELISSLRTNTSKNDVHIITSWHGQAAGCKGLTVQSIQVSGTSDASKYS